MACVAVVIPWRAGCAHRERAAEWVLSRYTWNHPDWLITIGVHDNGPWCKAAAVADALDRTDADTLVIADADVWCDELEHAVNRCETWAVPHRLVHRLDLAATRQLFDTGTSGPSRAERPYTGHLGGGITIVRRDIYTDCPLDPRFAGWGQEDDAWAHALRTIHGEPWRGGADLIHLWHPPQPRRTRSIGNKAGHALIRRYRAASRKPAQMRQLIAEHATADV